MKRTIHRLETELRLLQRRRRKHRVAIVLLVSTQLPQFALRDVRRVDKAIVPSNQLFAQIILHLLPNDAALRMPEDQSLAILFLNRKQIEFAPETPMIAFLGFFTLLQPPIQFFLREESRAVDALHLRPFGVAFPISARQRQQLERAQAIRVWHVRSKTEIDEWRTIDVINADRFAGLLVDQLTLQGFVAFSKDAQCFRFGDLVTAVRHVPFCDVAHLLFYHRKIAFGQRSQRDDIIKKSVTRIVKQCRPNSKLRARKKFEHRSREQMRGRMTQNFESFRFLRKNGFYLDG